MKTYVLLANGFEILETFSPVDVLKRCGAEVITVSINDDIFVESSQKNIVKADDLFDYTSRWISRLCKFKRK